VLLQSRRTSKKVSYCTDCESGFASTDSINICSGIVVGVIATNLPVAPSFHRQVIVVFCMRSGVFAVSVLAAGRAASCLVILNALRQC